MLAITLLTLALAPADDPKPAPVSFMREVAPILVRGCIGCHNAKKAESKYVMTTFALLAKGGSLADGANLVPGDADGSRFVELLASDASPRMPWKQEPMPKAVVDLITRWVAEGAKYDGTDPAEDWVALRHKTAEVSVPEAYPVAVPITALAFAPDGSGVAASGYHELNVWPREGISPKRRLRGLPERVYDLAYSPDGKWLATVGGDPGQLGLAQLWLAEPDGGGKLVRTLAESPDALFCVAFAPNGKTLAVGGADRAIRLFEAESGKQTGLIEDHADWVLDLAFSPDGTKLASASRDKTCKVFDVAKRESIATFPGHGDAVFSVAYLADGKTVASGGADAQVRLWMPDEEAKAAGTLGGAGGQVLKVVAHPDGKRIIAAGADKMIRVYENKSVKFTLSGHADWVYSLAISPDGKTLASGSWDGQVRLWNLDDGKPAGLIMAAPGLKLAGDASPAK